MASVTITSDRFPPGSAVRAYPLEGIGPLRSKGKSPKGRAATASGIVGSDSSVTITAAPGFYALVASTNEVQSVKVNATGGTFTLTFGGQTTAAIAYNANATTGAPSVRAKLEALSTIGTGNVSVSGGPGNSGGTTPYVVTFIGDLGGQDVAALTANAASLTGGAGTVTVTTTTQGSVTPTYVTVKTT